MVGLELQFDLGRYHAQPWGSHVNDAAVEWPPSPWRILRALYSLSRVDLALERPPEAYLTVIRRLAEAPPPTYVLPASVEGHTRHYFPARQYRAHGRGRRNKTDLVVDAFRAVGVEAALQIWWSAELRGPEREALDELADHLLYLGRSESLCSARLVGEPPGKEPDAAPSATIPDLDGDLVELLAPDPQAKDPVAALEISPSEMRKSGSLDPPHARKVLYTVRDPAQPSTVTSPVQVAPTLALFRLSGGSRPGLREAVAVGAHLRRAAMSRYGQRTGGAVSEVLAGKRGDAYRRDQHRHAHYMALSDDGRRVDRLAVWAPEGLGTQEVAALAAIDHLRLRDNPKPLPLALTALGHPAELDFPDLLGPAVRWKSVTPFGLPRHPKLRAGKTVDGPQEQVLRELELRGLPAPRGGQDGIRLVKGPWLQFRRTRPGVTRLEAPRAVGVELEFEEELRGPLALGALSHFGLGVFTPA
ncbi:MAG: type I-G CRISPR-associated protein Csb2 [Solirubrobacterales bacterium]